MDTIVFQQRESKHEQGTQMVHRFRNIGARKPGTGALAQSVLDGPDRTLRAGYAPIGLHELGVRRMVRIAPAANGCHKSRRRQNMSLNSSEDPRVRFAIERTLLAWIRTGLALMGFGFVVARFGLFLREIEAVREARR